MRLRPADIEQPRNQLRNLRNALALAAPRAQVQSHVPPELVVRLQAALKLVSRIYLEAGRAGDGVFAEALAEGQSALGDWELWLVEDKEQRKPVRPFSFNQRQHERYETNLPVRILRHSARDDIRGEVALDSAATLRQARNISLGGIFVTLREHELAEIVVGGVVNLSVGPLPGQPSPLGMRATVARRDASGLGLRWIVDSPRTQRLIDSILDGIQKPR